ncbi:MAG TPA: hypothetical protein VGD71_43375, partial [Kribbella sp.]
RRTCRAGHGERRGISQGHLRQGGRRGGGDGAVTVAQALENLRGTDETVDWTMLSPAQVIAPGERTGEFRLGLDAPVGERISAEDYAVALVDEIEKPAHRRQRFTLGY